MSADAPVESWKLTLPCTRAEAEAIDAADDLAIDAVIMTTETVEDDVETWRLDAYIEREPDAAMIAALVPSIVLFARHGKAARKMGVPFGPFLAVGSVVALFAGPWLLHAYLSLLAQAESTCAPGLDERGGARRDPS